MKKIYQTLVAGLFLITFASCSVSGPLFITDNPSGEKVGKSSYRMIFGFILDGGDASIRTAAENGGITKISTVDQRVESSLFITTYSTVVTGE